GTFGILPTSQELEGIDNFVSNFYNQAVKGIKPTTKRITTPPLSPTAETLGGEVIPRVKLKESKPELPKIKQPVQEAGQESISPISQTLSQTELKTPLKEAEKLRQSSPRKEAVDPLPNIISKSEIDVKNKVGILDYLRTPDRVLKKIGFEKEANFLRQQYAKYLKELPQEIDRITEWSKRVKPESNQKIFRYLDGQDIKLDKNELQVANEIKDYLKSWADRLGLPEDKRISHYITHIFEKDFIKKEFDPELAKIIQDKVAGSVYDPFLEKRLGKLGYIEDTWRALDAYVKRAVRKVNIDPALKKIKNKAKDLEISQYNYVKKFIDNVNLRPTEIDNLIDNTIKQVVGYRFGQRPTAYLTKIGRQAVYRGALGLNVGTALKNLTQVVNTYAKLGEKYTLKGYLDLLKNGVGELEEQGILKQGLIQDRSLNATRKFWETLDKGLFYFFETAEKINRGAAYYGAKAKALSQGLNEKQAIEYAKKIVRDTQFQFGSIDTPVLLQSDIAKLIAQFQTFSIKQAEFLAEMVKNKEYVGLLRYAIGSLALASTLGKLFGMEWKDFIPSFRIGPPPTLATPVEVGKAVLNVPDKYGNELDLKEKLSKIGETLVPYIPAGVQLKKTFEGIRDVIKGYSETPSGRVRYVLPQTTSNLIRGGIFGAYTFPEAREYFKNKVKPLGEIQSEVIKSSKDKSSLYNLFLKKREENEEIKKLREEAEKGILKQKGEKIPIVINGEVKILDLSKIQPKEGETEYQKALRLKKAFSYVDEILDSDLPVEKQGEILAKLGIDPEDASYYNVARQSSDIKYIWVKDEIGKYGDNRQEILNTLVSFRREVNGKKILTNEIIDDLVDEG
ncbi:MAG: hypothetical protein NC925_05860, partial [Candidatus Omnitrophica bacterium]|nr:hypothetical protein [Candidatus Omnitrophota bacterium]